MSCQRITGIIASAAMAVVCAAVFTAGAALAQETEQREVLVIAHRGASGHAPENTMASFRKALELGADMFELDVHRTMDGKIVVMHDADAKRTTGSANLLSMMKLEQIKKLDAGSWYGEEFKDERVPTLYETLQWAKGKIKVNIEIKSDGCEESVVKMVEELEMENEVIVTSFSHGYLGKIKELNPEIKTGALVKDITNEKELDKIIADCAPDAVNPRYLLVNKSIVRAAHERGLAVNVYTVNDPVTMNRLAKAGVDGIITNYPDMLIEVLGGKTE